MTMEWGVFNSSLGEGAAGSILLGFLIRKPLFWGFFHRKQKKLFSVTVVRMLMQICFIQPLQRGGPHSHQRGTGACLSLCPFPQRETSSEAGWEAAIKRQGPVVPDLKMSGCWIMLKFPFLAPNRSYGSLLSNIHGHLFCKVGYYFFNAVGFHSVTSEERKEKKYIGWPQTQRNDGWG